MRRRIYFAAFPFPLTRSVDFPNLASSSGRRSQVAKAADCKSAIAGSNPAGAFCKIRAYVDGVSPFFVLAPRKAAQMAPRKAAQPGDARLATPNPYETSRTTELAAETNHLASVRRTFWWSGVVCMALGILNGAIHLIEFVHGRCEVTEFVVFQAANACHVLFMNYCRIVGKKLEDHPESYRRRARWTGFVLALYFPVFTGPGLYCVWTIDKYFCEKGNE